jgi:hypothetical protein
MIFNELKTLTETFLTKLESCSEQIDEGHQFDWPNYVFKSHVFRRAHLDVVDVSITKKLYMVHLCIFPHRNDSSPIFGFDLIAGPKKITGVFHDFSAGVDKSHFMIDHFRHVTQNLEWSKKRTLPEWAQNIFSDNMVAAGNVQDENEMKTIFDLATSNLNYYLENVGKTISDTTNSYPSQSYYCENQRKNPHTPKVMESLGFDADTVHKFITECLFPEVS